MTNEQAQKVLDELQDVRPEQLKDEAKRLFEAIIKIADERDKIKQEYDRDTHILQNQLDLADAKNIEKDKIIDLMSEQLTTPIHDKKWVKEYYERKAKEYLKER